MVEMALTERECWDYAGKTNGRGRKSMTKEQKVRIKMLKTKGVKYSDISADTGIPVGTIKTFCHRNGLTTSVNRVVKQNRVERLPRKPQKRSATETQPLMTEAQFRKQKLYETSMHFATVLFSKGLISSDEYAEIDIKMLAKRG